MDGNKQLKVMDVKTREQFSLDPTDDRREIKTRDGVKVRVHPASLMLMVPRGRKFSGHTNRGLRDMIRL